MLFAFWVLTISNDAFITSNDLTISNQISLSFSLFEGRKEKRKEKKRKEKKRDRGSISRKRRRRTRRYSPRQKPNFSALSRSTRANNLTSKKSLLRPEYRERVAQCLLREARPVCPECLASPVGEAEEGRKGEKESERERRGEEKKRKEGRDKKRKRNKRRRRGEKVKGREARGTKSTTGVVSFVRKR